MEISFGLIKEYFKKEIDIDLISNKSLYDQGVDELDLVEIIMQIERDFNIIISDELIDKIHIESPNKIFIDSIREEKLNKILN
jgi:acyl carrier protein